MDFDQTPPSRMPPVPPRPKKDYKPVARFVAIVLIVAVSYMAGYGSGSKGYVFEPKSFKIVNRDQQPQNVDYNLLWDAIDVLNKKYIDQPVNPQTVLYGAIRGAVESTGDPYTDFFEPKELQNFQTNLKGEFDGIGAEIGKKDGFITVVAPLDDSPAKKAGIQAQDIIAQVNGESTADWSVDQAVEKIRGKKGTSVALTIVRQGKDQPFDVSVTRDTIQVKSVKLAYKDVAVGGKKKTIAVITITQFGDDTDSLFNQAANDILTHSVDGIILDLRNNPGGYLQSAVDVASSWLQPGTLVVSEDKSDGSSDKYNASGNPRLANIKTVALINGGTASAAEILSGALHDHNVAELIGDKSFGKGSVQELVPLKDGSAIKVTVAKWITPNGKNLNKDGLDPDIAVELTDDNAAHNQDPQMDKAVQEVTKQ